MRADETVQGEADAESEEPQAEPVATIPEGWGLKDALREPGFILSARRLWLISIALYRSGHRRPAKWLQHLNAFLYNNYLPAEVQVNPNVRLGHNAQGSHLNPKIVIGSGVKIMQNVTMAVRPPWSSHQIVVEDRVTIGANSVVMTRRNQGLRIGRGSRVGAGAVVTRDIPPQTIAVSPPVELRPLRPPDTVSEDDGDE